MRRGGYPRPGRRCCPMRGTKRATRKKGGDSSGELEEILRTVAHDLKTPLVAIQGFAQLLEISGREGGLSEKQRKYVDCILQAARSMNSILDDMTGSREGSKN